jgi:hypothetical protein
MIVNPYGLFAIMTTTRPEIVIEGSADGEVWREYVFRYKPGPLARPALWNIPHQPRLDWQMWFAALGSLRDNPWIESLMRRLLEGSPTVLALLDAAPFADRPPKYVRAQLYDYHFANQRTHLKTGEWWVRRPEGLYFPQVSLADFESAPLAGSNREWPTVDEGLQMGLCADHTGPAPRRHQPSDARPPPRMIDAKDAGYRQEHPG